MEKGKNNNNNFFSQCLRAFWASEDEDLCEGVEKFLIFRSRFFFVSFSFSLYFFLNYI